MAVHFLYKFLVNFYPRSPCGERRPIIEHDLNNVNISIHALLAESDNDSRTGKRAAKKFLSTLSLRRAT